MNPTRTSSPRPATPVERCARQAMRPMIRQRCPGEARTRNIRRVETSPCVEHRQRHGATPVRKPVISTTTREILPRQADGGGHILR